MQDFQDQSHSQKQQTMNWRAYSRNIPSKPLQPYLDARPMSTKFTCMSVGANPSVSRHSGVWQYATFSPKHTFNPGDGAPWSGFASNINIETELRRSTTNNPETTYIPSSYSSLYQVKWSNTVTPSQPFPELFQSPTFASFDPNPSSQHIGLGLFNNDTRQQLKDLDLS